MILDQINNAHLYASLHPRFVRTFEILEDKSLSQKQDGKYPIDGDNVYYSIQKYTTKPLSEGKLEAHRKYIDIQFLLSGVELLGYAPLKDLTVAEEYNTEKDIAFYETPKEITKVNLEPGLFCILFPDDAHLPGCHLIESSNTRKVVIKIRL